MKNRKEKVDLLKDSENDFRFFPYSNAITGGNMDRDRTTIMNAHLICVAAAASGAILVSIRDRSWRGTAEAFLLSR